MSNETKTNPYGLSDAQVAALRCMHADAAGVYQCAIRDGNGGSENGHDWKAHRQSVEDLEDAFPEILEHIPLDDEESDSADNYLTDNEWDAQFDPTYEEDGNLREIKEGDADWAELVAAKRVWTMMDCDGDLYIGPGVHFVNRMSYHVTRLPWTDTTPDVLWHKSTEEGEEE
jgi:hypothetical protein